MSSFLYALGRGAYRHKWRTAGVWLLVIAVLGGAAGLLRGSFDNGFSIPGAPSQIALTQLQNTFPQVAGTSATVIVVAPQGETVDTSAVKRGVERSIDEFSKLDFVDTVSDPWDDQIKGQINDDRRAAIVSVRIPGDSQAVTDAQRAELTAIGDRLQSQVPGMQVGMGGEVFQINLPHLSVIEAIGVVVALVVLCITLGSLVAAGMPLLTAILGVGVSMLILLACTGLTSINSTTPMLAVMLGLAVGIDYALFILSRHRELMSDGLAAEESAARSVATAGSAVVFAGMTVIIALLGLGIAGIPFLTTMGIFAAIGVAVAVLIALTLLPALMGMAGERMRPRHARKERSEEEAAALREKRARGGAFGWWVRMVTRVPALTIVLVIAASIALSVPARGLHLALPNAGEHAIGTPSRTAYDLTSEYFGAGANGPLVLTADIIGSDDPLGVMDDLKSDIEAMPGVDSVPLATPNQNAEVGFVQIVPTTGPDDVATADLVQRLREEHQHWLDEYGVSTAVTGATAVQIDVSDQLGAALLPFGIFVVGLSLILLTLVFRSIAVPIKATLGYLLSIGVSFGLTTLVFNEGVGASLINLEKSMPVISFLPILLMGILFGLAMDYEVFLVSRMREDHVHGRSAREAVRTGFVGSGKVVTAAAVIMFAVFAFFVPEGDSNLKPIAFALAVGVAFDAFVVRMTLVPAVMSLLGERAWWLPRWLDKRLPELDVEGEQLHRELELADWPGAAGGSVVHAERITVGTLFAPIDVDLSGGQVLVVAGDTRTRSAVLLALTGRLRTDDGVARIAGVLVPGTLSRLRRAARLVEPEDLDSPAGIERVRRWLGSDQSLLAVDRADQITGEGRSLLAELVARTAGGDQALVLGATDPALLADVLSREHLLLAPRPAAPHDPDPRHGAVDAQLQQGVHR